MFILKFLMKLEEFNIRQAYECQMKRIKYGQSILNKLNYSLVKLEEEQNKIKEKMDEVKMYM